MVRIVDRKMRRRPFDLWPVTCQRALPAGPLPLRDIAKILGCCYELVRQIERDALAKVRRSADLLG